MNCTTCEHAQTVYKDTGGPGLYCLHEQARDFLQPVDGNEAVCRYYFAVVEGGEGE